MDLDLSVSGLGRPKVTPEVEILRELNAADIALLESDRQVKAPSLQKIRDSHHALARILATGAKPYEASLVTGYSPSRISILQADPAFQELLEFYRAQGDIPVASVVEKIALVKMDALNVIHEDLLDGTIRGADALDVFNSMADRSGHGKATKQTVDINMSIADRVASGRSRAMKVIEQSPALLQPPGSAQDEGAGSSTGTVEAPPDPSPPVIETKVA